MTATDDVHQRLRARGVALAHSALNENQLRFLLSAVDQETAGGAVRHPSGHTYGVRGLLTTRPEIATHLEDLLVSHLVSEALGCAAFPIDAIFFDKRADANWSVPAHQDVVVPVPSTPDPVVRRRRVRGALTYGEPPVSVLNELLAVRVHFDPSDEESGVLCVIPASHLRGRVRETEMASLPLDAFQPCRAAAGDLLLMRPLVIHRSGRSTGGAHRRVLHVLYAPTDGWHGG